VPIVVKIRKERDAFGLKMAVAAVSMLSTFSCGFSSPTAVPMPAPSFSCPSPSQAPMSVEQPDQIASASQDVMNHLNYTIKRSQYQHTSKKSGDVSFKVRCGQNLPFAEGGANKTYTITSAQDNSASCPNATCWVIHVESVYNPGNIPTASDVWVDRATMRWFTRHQIDKNIVSAGDMSIETTDTAVFD
jgi:hypothetical protein